MFKIHKNCSLILLNTNHNQIKLTVLSCKNHKGIFWGILDSEWKKDAIDFTELFFFLFVSRVGSRKLLRSYTSYYRFSTIDPFSGREIYTLGALLTT